MAFIPRQYVHIYVNSNRHTRWHTNLDNAYQAAPEHITHAHMHKPPNTSHMHTAPLV